MRLVTFDLTHSLSISHSPDVRPSVRHAVDDVVCGSVRPEPRGLVLRPHPPSMQPAAAAAAAAAGDDDDDDDDEGDDVTVQRLSGVSCISFEIEFGAF